MPPMPAPGVTWRPPARISPGSSLRIPARLRSRNGGRIAGLQRRDDLLGDPLQIVDALLGRARQAVDGESDAVQAVFVAGARQGFQAIICRTMNRPVVQAGRRVELEGHHARLRSEEYTSELQSQ